MELPITRPSRMFYADQINFSELLGELKAERFNGFIRVTSGSSEGYILFNNGKQSAASFDDYIKKDALTEIKSALDNNRTLIDVFDLKSSQMEYLLDLNKLYILDFTSKADEVRDEIQKSEKIAQTSHEEKISNDKNETIDTKPDTASNKIEENEKKAKFTAEVDKSSDTVEADIPLEKIDNVEVAKEESEGVENQEVSPNVEPTEKIEALDEEKVSTSSPEGESEKPEFVDAEAALDTEDVQYQNEFIEPGIEVDRTELMKKYGLKDVGDEEVENILDTYKGGSLSDDDIEKIELTLMNKVKKSILGIPKIRGTEVMVFLDNSAELTGNINIISEYESKGLLSRIMGDSKDLENIRRQIINITQIEIKKSFRKYPEIVEDFDINLEIS